MMDRGMTLIGQSEVTEDNGTIGGGAHARAHQIASHRKAAAVDWRTSEDLLQLIEGWHRERRTVAAVLHDLDQVRAHFPDTLLIARECVAWGATGEVVTPANMLRARHMSEAWSAEAENCRRAPREWRPSGRPAKEASVDR